MSHKKRAIHPIDFLFLSLEKRRQPMHVAGLLLFKIPPSAPDDFVQKLAEEIRQSKQMPMSPFGDRLNGLFWQQDERFDIDHHFRHIALPKPGRIRELFMYVSQEHSTLLDRAKPMWTCTLIEGIEGNRFAIYCKIHHALVDGVAAFRLLEKTLSSQPDDQNVVPLWCLRTPLASPA
ncbi:MAG: wax ester/triacylglycerol synthase family O-acyltransferase, partial [Acinetobacter sp.]|nr:wax ester/triacylglycerol synthase family O-acyltransferase [Acinetobacter sp.]